MAYVVQGTERTTTRDSDEKENESKHTYLLVRAYSERVLSIS